VAGRGGGLDFVEGGGAHERENRKRK
jgi:hypothetical protein